MSRPSQPEPLSLEQLFGVKGLVALITGGGTGIGLMIARALAHNGAKRVYIVGRRKEVIEKSAALHPSIVPLQGDITQTEDLELLAKTIKDDVGYLNLVVANAGITGPTFEKLKPHASLAEFVKLAKAAPRDEFNSVYDLNCTAVFYTICTFLELLEAGNQHAPVQKSQVIAIASTAAFLRNARAGYAYCSSKAALVSMMKCFSTQCVPWGIRFNVLAAGLFPSELSSSLLAPFKLHPDKDVTEEGAFARSYQPAERAGSSDDMAGAALYLASRAGAFLNGSVLLVDGGKIAISQSTY